MPLPALQAGQQRLNDLYDLTNTPLQSSGFRRQD